MSEHIPFGFDALRALFQPRSVAVIGASSNPQKIGGIPVQLLQKYGFAGDVYPVNPRHESIQGLRAWASVQDIEKPPELAIVAVPAAGVYEAIGQCGRAGVKSAVVFSSGFAEVGDEGAVQQEQLRELGRSHGVRILGPNCLGVINTRIGLVGTFSPAVVSSIASPGRIGIVSQSGAFGMYAYCMARERGIAIGDWIATGNEADIEFADCLAYMARDENTDVVLGYMEGCRDGEKLKAALALAAENRKPVVIVKVGVSSIGGEAARSHTAALAGSDATFDALFRQYNVCRASSIEEAFDITYAAAQGETRVSRNLGLITVSGGAGILMADEASRQGLCIPELPADAQARIRDVVPFAAPRNPVDATGQVASDMGLYEKIIDHALSANVFDTVVAFQGLAALSPRYGQWGQKMWNSFIDRYPDKLFVFASVMQPEYQREMEEAGAICFGDPTRAVRAIGAVVRIKEGFDAWKRPSAPEREWTELPSVGGTDQSELTALRLFASAGIPVIEHRHAASAADCARAVEELGVPTAVKVLSPDIVHKSDAGGVRLNVDAAAAAGAFAEIRNNVRKAHPEARFEGVLVTPMKNDGVETIVGAHVDPVFGPVIMFGLGGVAVEVLRDVTFRVAPFDREVAMQMIADIRAAPILDGYRLNWTPDKHALADTLSRLSCLAYANRDSFRSMELNPLLVLPEGSGVVALDAAIET
ncbi:MAG TPA: acetate--CoA ligase family protein [Gammaproteobacteria bacterium]|nr:acetate--CoA ligase family protein [Gammaproteobacteria bacterium]